jgi:hypothetical protein
MKALTKAERAWRQLSLAEARARALTEAHLVAREGGQLVGAPRGVTMRKLKREVRPRLDAAAQEGAFGASWYEDARRANTGMSGGDPRLATELAAGQAIYSPQATPPNALNWTLAQKNRSILEGPEAAGRSRYRTGVQARQYQGVLEGKDPEVALGPKTGPYFRQMDPSDKGASVVGVNDSWMGRLYGHKPGRSGFSESEHNFMTGENILARGRADAAGFLPEGTPEGVGPWQAAAWTGAKLRALKARKPGASAADLQRQAQASVPDAARGFAVHETTEKIPSRASGHMAGAADLPLEQKRTLTRGLSTEGEADPYYQALGMPQQARTEGLGQFTETLPPLKMRAAFRDAKTGKSYVPTAGFHNMDELPDRLQQDLTRIEEGFVDNEGKWYTRKEAADAMREAGQQVKMYPMRSEYLPEGESAARTRTDYNPNVSAHPMSSYAPGQETPAMNAPEEEMVRGVNTLRSAADVQAAGAYHMVKPSASPQLQTAARVTFPGGQLDPEFTALLYDRVNQAGLSLIDTGGGAFTITGDFGAMPAAKFRQTFAKLAPEFQGNGADVQLGSYVGHYNELPAYGEGRVTERVLENVSPRVGEKLNTPGLRRAWRGQNAAETRMAEELGLGAPRADVQKFRSILGRGGVERLREHVKKYGKAGLPAVTILPNEEE